MTEHEGINAPTSDEFEKLLVNNDGVARIEAYLNRFNPIRVMRMERMEIRHSAILAWLLDPRESHGLNDKFLKAFIGEALRGRSSKGRPTALDVARADLRDTAIRREWQNIDIFIHSESNGWGFVVENKFDSKQHEGQLTKYLEKVKAGLGSEAVDMEFDGEMAFGGIFLTLDGEEPQDPRYAPITYETVIQVLSRCIEQNAYLLTAEVKTFLQHYVEIIEEEVGLSAERSDMERLARQLYRENKKVLDFIISTGGGSDFSIAAEHFFGEDLTKNQEIEIEGQRLLFNQLDQKVVSFLPDSWYRPLSDIEWAGCEKWWSGFPLIAWFQLWPDAKGTSGTLGLYGEVGPISDYSLRRDLIQAIQQSAEETGTIRIKFQQAAANEGKRYSKFFNKNFRSIKDVQDAAEITDVMTKLFREFRPEFDLVGAAVQRFAAGRDAKV